jgi:hypothetical protein
VSLGDLMCKNKHIGTDVEIRPTRGAFLDVVFEPKLVLNRIEYLDAGAKAFRTRSVTLK